MKKFNQFMAIGGMAFVLAFAGTKALGQGGGGFGGGGGGGMGGMGAMGFDPTQVVPMLVDRMRPSLSVTNDDEWKIISAKLTRVVQMHFEEQMAGMSGMMKNLTGGAGPGGAGGGGAGRAAGFLTALGGAPDPTEDALSQALDDNAPSAQLKVAMEKLRAVRKRKVEEKAKAQSELRDLLTVRQEATLLSMGFLD